MKRFSKRLLWIGVPILLVLGTLVYFGYFRSTNAALLRAESFDFRRMQVPRVDDQEKYRFFFATNRGAGAVDGPIEERFTTERVDRLLLGSFDTEIKPTLGLGRWLDASSWFLDEEIKIRNVQELERDAFVEQLRGMVAESPHRALLLFVHGYRTDFDFALRGTAFLARILDIDAPVMMFDWPGNQGDSLRGYRRAQQVATASGADLAETLRLIVRDVQPQRLWLVANSMGGQVVVDAFSQLYADGDFADIDTEIDEVVLTAPDVDHARFNDQFKRELAALARHTTVYVSSNDRALLVSRVVNRGRRLGESTLSKQDAALFEEVDGLLDLVEGDTGRVTLIDVTPVNRTRNFHNFSLEVPEYFDDLFLRLTNSETPQNRVRYQFETPQGKVYSVLTRGR
jgi:esterase/lipase superfamily enzyme